MFENATCWKSNLQSVMTLSTTHVGYITPTKGISHTKIVKDVLWLNGMVEELGIVHDFVVVHYDSYNDIHIIDNQIYHERTKYINVTLHFVRDTMEYEVQAREDNLNGESCICLQSICQDRCLDDIWK